MRSRANIPAGTRRTSSRSCRLRALSRAPIGDSCAAEEPEARPEAPSQIHLLRRPPENPLLTAEDWPYPCNTVFNPGAVRLVGSGETLLLCRVEDRRRISHLTPARSADAVTGWRVASAPTLLPDPEHYPEEVCRIEDPRIIWVP